MKTLKTINIQINTLLMLSGIINDMVNKFSLTKDEENAIVIYDENERSDIFHSQLTDEQKVIWDDFIEMCINKVGTTKENLSQIINQYEENRILINLGNIFSDYKNQFIVEFNELDTSELLKLNNFDLMIKTII